MFKKTYSYLNKPKAKIGWVYGFSVIFACIFLSYLTGMVISSIKFNDYTIQIIPSMIMTPIFMSIFGLWLLNSSSFYKMLKNFFIAFIILLILLFI